MLDFFKKKKTDHVTVVVKVSGMHCISCAMNIDGALEELEGIVSATTSYAKSEVAVEYLEKKVSLKKIVEVIEEQGYQVNM